MPVLEAEAAKEGLKINEQKTKYLLRLEIGWFSTPDELWLLATWVLKSSTNFCTWEFLWHRITTWVRRYSEGSKLEIGVSEACETSAVISLGTSDKVNDLQDLDPLGSVERHCNVGADKKEREPITRLGRKILRTIRDPNIDGLYRSRYIFELDRGFNSSNVIGVVKRNRLRYAEHMTRGVEVIPHRALYRAPCQKADETKEYQNPGGQMVWIAIAGFLGNWTGISLEIGYNRRSFSDSPWPNLSCRAI
jgi:hypothetical protein